ncbi:MAG: hypothetical protein ABWY80_09085 [Acidimicrobiia bacterium]
MNLLVIEMRRALHRRLVRVLILLALVAIVVAGVIEFLASTDLDVAALLAKGKHDPAVMTDWWQTGGDAVILIAAFFLVMGGLLGGASVVGAEWRAGTIGTVLTWEPRRVRLHAARVGSAALLAAVIAFVLQALLLAAFVPSVLAHGTTAGVDGEWVVSLVSAMARVSLLTALATVLGCALATFGRNTVAAIVVAWGWLAIGEGMVRGLLPDLQRWLIGENASIVLTWTGIRRLEASPTPLVALLTIVGCCLVFAVGSAVFFNRRDVVAA